jgi:ketosteroid isomerase-like protein
MRVSSIYMLVAVSACQPHRGVLARPSATREAEGTIRSAREAWNAAFARRDTVALAAQWAQDGELIGEAGRWRGRGEIVRGFYAGLFQYRPDITFTREPTRIEGHEAQASFMSLVAGSRVGPSRMGRRSSGEHTSQCGAGVAESG